MMSAVSSFGILAVVIGFGLAGGGALGSWRYGGGLGRWSIGVFRAWMRYGAIAGAVGLVLVGIAAIAH
jgi:hypothetical protein